MMIVSFSCVFRNLKRTYQASNLSDEFGKKRKYNDYRKEKRKSSLFSSPSVCVSVSDSFSFIRMPHTHLLYSFPSRFQDSCLVDRLLGGENFLELLKSIGGSDSMVPWKES